MSPHRRTAASRPMTPAALSAFMASETTRWQPIAQAAGMKK
jgi:tripartite-type tricarboxylate transporter receptor subunit TctC